MIEIIIAVLLAMLIFITKRCLDVLKSIQDTVKSIQRTSDEELRLFKDSLRNGQVKPKRKPSRGDESVDSNKRAVDAEGEQLDAGSSNKSNPQPEVVGENDEQSPASRGDEPKYTKLRVSGGKLEECLRGQVSYYRCWREEGRILYEFSSDPSSKERLAINNHSTQIDPFCQIENGSTDVEFTKHVEVTKAGELNEDYTVKSKCVVKFE